MDISDFSVPTRQLINVVTMTQALIFFGILAAPRFHKPHANQFLAAALLIMATVKGDQLFQMLGGLQFYPQYGFLLAPFQALMTPVLYLYVTAKTTPDFVLRKGYVWHATPLVLMFIYLFAIYYRLDLSDKSAMAMAGGFATPFNRLIVPLISDAVQLGYVIAALNRLGRYGVSLRNWFSHVEDRDLRWLKRLMAIWGMVFIFHVIWTISAGAFAALPVARGVLSVLDVIHLAMVNALLLMGVTAHSQEINGQRDDARAAAKYAASTLTKEERKALFDKTVAIMAAERLFLTPELTLRMLADRVNATPRELSESINDAGGQSFFDFINYARIVHAQRLLIDDNDMRVLDIAYQSGFKSKTSFNEAFKKFSDATPSAFRRKHGSSRESEQSVEKST